MLLACISNPTEIERAKELCDGVELCEPKRILIHKGQGSTYIDLPWEVPYGEPQMRVASYHNFEETPEDLDLLFAQMQSQPAAIYKIATMARSGLDALRMARFVQRMAEKGHQLIGLCMGEDGIPTRVLSPIVGNVWNYTFIDTPSAPGQLSIDALSTYNYRHLSPKTALFGLIGNPIGQSRSYITHNAYYREKGVDAVYVRIRLEADELERALSLMQKIGFKGLSVTIPYKEKILPFIDHLDPKAREIGAVNTLKFTPEGIYGYNTDAQGGIEALGEDMAGKKIVCLGAGGAAKALAYEARKRGAEVLLFNRAQMAAGIPKSYDILINATPNPCPIDPEAIVPGCTVMEINTRFTETELLKAAQAKGCRIVLGMEMFWRQALLQFELWQISSLPKTPS